MDGLLQIVYFMYQSEIQNGHHRNTLFIGSYLKMY